MFLRAVLVIKSLSFLFVQLFVSIPDQPSFVDWRPGKNSERDNEVSESGAEPG